jgi:phosphatidylserine decarboxylase
VFLNIFDVHVNRAPIGGRIARLAYYPGKFLNAFDDKASELNERQSLRIETPQGEVFGLVQIAGLIARRIVFTKKVGDYVALGERIGLIKFGSRMDVLFGPEWEITTEVGKRVAAGTTVLAHRR